MSPCQHVTRTVSTKMMQLMVKPLGRAMREDKIGHYWPPNITTYWTRYSVVISMAATCFAIFLWSHHRAVLTIVSNAMGQRSSWEANRSLYSQEILRVLWNSNVHYRIQKSPSLLPIQSHVSEVRAFLIIIYRYKHRRSCVFLIHWG
jgi:hypothetical protein